MTAIAKEMRDLLSEGFSPGAVGEALGVDEKTVTSITHQLIASGHLSPCASLVIEKAACHIEGAMQTMINLSVAAESESVRLTAAKMILDEATGRENLKHVDRGIIDSGLDARKTVIFQFNGISQMKEAQRAVDNVLEAELV